MMDKGKFQQISARCLRRWYCSGTGKEVKAQLHTAIEARTSDVFGYFALEYGVLGGGHRFLGESRVKHCFRGALCQKQADADFIAQGEFLPIAFDNVDLVIATHVLDYADDPHGVLREIERILVPEGHCILVGMNPVSLSGVSHLWQRLRRQPCVRQFHTSYRLREWFRVLGFDVIETRTFGLLPKVPERFARYLPFGTVYMLHVKKKVSKVIPLKPKLQAPVLKPGVVVSPTTGQVGRAANGVKRIKTES